MSRNRHLPNVLTPFEAPYATREERQEFAAGLRAMADWIEETCFPIPLLAMKRHYETQLDVPSSWIDDEGFVKRAGTAARLIGGKVDKGQIDYSTEFKLERDFGGGVKFRYRIARDAVCERVETTVMEDRVVPEDETAARTIESQIDELKKELGEMPTTIKTVPVPKTSYVCPESLIVKEKAEQAVEDESVPF